MVVVIQSSLLINLPPLISLLQVLKARGERIVYLGLIEDDSTRRILEDIGINSKLYNFPLVAFKKDPLLNVWQKLTNRIRPYLMRRWLWCELDEFKKDDGELIVWSADMRASAMIGDKARSLGRRYIQTLYELGEESGKNYRGFDIERLYAESTIVECEYNRAHILKAEHGLSRLPFVLPNKPYAHPRERYIDIDDTVLKSIVKKWNGKRVFLYQGVVQEDRKELFDIIEALCVGLPDIVVAVMCKMNPTIEKLLRKYKNFCHVPFVRPPQHLLVTSHADIGIAYYKGGAVWGLSPLNGVYCAPNKIFEYSGFGVPVLGNDIPGLRYSVGAKGAGICVEDLTTDNIITAARELLDNYDKYSNAAREYFDSIDIEHIVDQILSYSRS